jgi:hypothetical protein
VEGVLQFLQIFFIFLLTGSISPFKPTLKFTSIIYFFRGKGGWRALKTTSPLGVIKQKEMKNDKGREGGSKIGKMGRRRLWMAPYENYIFF